MDTTNNPDAFYENTPEPTNPGSGTQITDYANHPSLSITNCRTQRKRALRNMPEVNAETGTIGQMSVVNGSLRVAIDTARTWGIQCRSIPTPPHGDAN